MHDGDATDRLDLESPSSTSPSLDAAASATAQRKSGSSGAPSSVDGCAHEAYQALTKPAFDPDKTQVSSFAPSSPPSTQALTLPHLGQVTGVDRFDAGALSKLPALPDTTGLAGGAPVGSVSESRDAGLRQLAILQSLVARQTAALREGLPLSPAGLPAGPPSLPPIQLPLAPASTPDVPAYSTSSLPTAHMQPSAHHWQTNLEGLNHVPSVGPSGASYSPLGTVTADELLAAQASLDLWSSTVFNSNSPATSPPATSYGPHSSVAVQQRHSPSSLNWSTLYPSNDYSESPTSAGLSPLPPLGHAPTHGSPPTSSDFFPSASFASYPSFPFARAAGSSSALSAIFHPGPLGSAPPARAPSPPSQHEPASGAPTPARRSSRANAGAKGRAVRASASSAEASEESGSAGTSPQAGGALGDGHGGGHSEGLGGGFSELPAMYTNAQGVTKARELMTPDEIEEDKRRRNTEASGTSILLSRLFPSLDADGIACAARFRAKKKLRDAELKQSSASLRERVASLEKEKESVRLFLPHSLSGLSDITLRRC